MGLSVGIDTGGTYTDAVIYDRERGLVLARGKSPTTHDRLERGIGKALDALPYEMLSRAETVVLSTTLATNACVEGKGGQARLVMMGTRRKTLEWVQADKNYGLDPETVLCLEEHGASDGSAGEMPDWDAILSRHAGFFGKAEALSVVELNAMQNGGIYERNAADAFQRRLDVPVVCASDLVSGLNIMERGATAQLNARLLPVIDRFLRAVREVLSRRGLTVPCMVVRSDGSLMTGSFARVRPVETILSGPAASVCGCRALARAENAILVDMGGTTTDISVMRGGDVLMKQGIRIGGWRTQVSGVYMDTVALGGDTRIRVVNTETALDTVRVEPLCVLARRCPEIMEELRRLIDEKRSSHSLPLHEFLYLVRMPSDLSQCSEGEKRCLEILSRGPAMLGGGALDAYDPASARLEREGFVMRAGLTPTDIMHIRGDFTAFDAEASRLAARFFLRVLPDMRDTEEDLHTFCARVYELVAQRLYENIVRVFLEAAYPEVYGAGPDEQTRELIRYHWKTRQLEDPRDFFELKPAVKAVLIGVGAPIHLFLPEVAGALGAEYVIPKDAAVANAVGAAAAGVSACAEVQIGTGTDEQGRPSYCVYAQDRVLRFEHYEQAVEAAKEAAVRLAREEARRRGATGALDAKVRVEKHLAHDRYGAQIDLGTSVSAALS